MIKRTTSPKIKSPTSKIKIVSVEGPPQEVVFVPAKSKPVRTFLTKSERITVAKVKSKDTKKQKKYKPPPIFVTPRLATLSPIRIPQETITTFRSTHSQIRGRPQYEQIDRRSFETKAKLKKATETTKDSTAVFSTTFIPPMKSTTSTKPPVKATKTFSELVRVTTGVPEKRTSFRQNKPPPTFATMEDIKTDQKKKGNQINMNNFHQNSISSTEKSRVEKGRSPERTIANRRQPFQNRLIQTDTGGKDLVDDVKEIPSFKTIANRRQPFENRFIPTEEEIIDDVDGESYDYEDDIAPPNFPLYEYEYEEDYDTNVETTQSFDKGSKFQRLEKKNEPSFSDLVDPEDIPIKQVTEILNKEENSPPPELQFAPTYKAPLPEIEFTSRIPVRHQTFSNKRFDNFAFIKSALSVVDNGVH